MAVRGVWAGLYFSKQPLPQYKWSQLSNLFFPYHPSSHFFIRFSGVSETVANRAWEQILQPDAVPVCSWSDIKVLATGQAGLFMGSRATLQPYRCCNGHPDLNHLSQGLHKRNGCVCKWIQVITATYLLWQPWQTYNEMFAFTQTKYSTGVWLFTAESGMEMNSPESLESVFSLHSSFSAAFSVENKCDVAQWNTHWQLWKMYDNDKQKTGYELNSRHLEVPYRFLFFE